MKDKQRVNIGNFENQGVSLFSGIQPIKQSKVKYRSAAIPMNSLKWKTPYIQ